MSVAPTTTKHAVPTATKSVRRVLSDIVEVLACPLCGADLTAADDALGCLAGHSFDIARHGYASLLPGDAHTGTADTQAMTDSRGAFLGAGHFAPVAEAVTDAVSRTVGEASGCVVDVGAGTGYYLAQVLDHLPGHTGLALDISKFAMRRAARAHPRMGAAVCDAWRTLPVRSGSAAAVLNIFAPRNAAEFQRILRPEGVLISVTPTAKHLQELIEPLGLLRVDEDKAQRLEDQLGSRFERVSSTGVEGVTTLSHEDVSAVASMGPSAWHTDGATLQVRISALEEPVEVTFSVTVGTYKVKAGDDSTPTAGS